MNQVMTANEFDHKTHAMRFKISQLTGRTKFPLRDIHALLVQFHASSRHQLNRRQELLHDIAEKCASYVGAKPQPGVKGSKKIDAVCLLGHQAALRAQLENEKVAQYGAKLNGGSKFQQGGQRIGVDVKGNNKFERAMKPGFQVAGHEAWSKFSKQLDVAERNGDDANKAYALRQLLKSIGPEGIRGENLLLQYYFSDSDRELLRTHVEKSKLVRYGGPVETRGVSCLPNNHCIFAMSLEGELYTVNYAASSNTQINHSSILAGQDVLCAGTIRAHAGVLIDIATNSGHYKPQREDMLRCVKQLIADGLEYDVFSEAHVAFYDKVGTDWCTFRMPLWLFVETSGLPPNRNDFSGYYAPGHGEFKYDNVQAARNRGCTGPMR